MKVTAETVITRELLESTTTQNLEELVLYEFVKAYKESTIKELEDYFLYGIPTGFVPIGIIKASKKELNPRRGITGV